MSGSKIKLKCFLRSRVRNKNQKTPILNHSNNTDEMTSSNKQNITADILMNWINKEKRLPKELRPKKNGKKIAIKDLNDTPEQIEERRLNTFLQKYKAKLKSDYKESPWECPILHRRIFGTPREELEGFVNIKATFKGKDITETFMINKDGVVFNTKSKNYPQLNTMSHGEELPEPSYTFAYGRCRTEVRLKSLINTYFPSSNEPIVGHKKIVEIDGHPLNTPYMIYDDGRVSSLIAQKKSQAPRDLIVTLDADACESPITPTDRGYRSITLKKADGTNRCINLHLLVKSTFDPIEDYKDRKLEVHHIDYNPSNNALVNLKWVTQHENSLLKKCRDDPNCSITFKKGVREYKDGSVHKDAWNVAFSFKGEAYFQSFGSVEEARAWRDETYRMRLEEPDKVSRETMGLKPKPERAERELIPPPELEVFKLPFDKYWLYKDGRVWSMSSGRFLNSFKDKDGYLHFSFGTNTFSSFSGKMCWSVHRLVAYLFIPVSSDPDNCPFDVDHIDRNRENNRAENLRYVDKKTNQNNKKK
jgi:hypothetical protein